MRDGSFFEAVVVRLRAFFRLLYFLVARPGNLPGGDMVVQIFVKVLLILFFVIMLKLSNC